MIWAIVILSMLVIFLTTMLVLVSQKCLLFQETLQATTEQIEESLDVINEIYEGAARRAEYDILLDEPVVRELVSDLKNTKKALLMIANKITSPFEEEIETEGN